MKRAATLLAGLLTTLLVLAATAGADSERLPMALQFDYARHILTSAETARDAGEWPKAMVLFDEARIEYERLKNDFPDHEPGVTAFRIDHCVNEMAKMAGASPREPGQPTPPERAHEPPPRATTGTVAVAAAETNASPTASKLEALKRQARELMEAGQGEAARDVMISALEIDPDDLDVRLLISMAQCQAGQYESAVFAAEDLLADEPSNAVVQVVLGTAYAGLGDLGSAQSALMAAVAADPALGEAHFNLARLFLIEGKHMDDARAAYQRALELGVAPDAALARDLGLATDGTATEPPAVRAPQ